MVKEKKQNTVVYHLLKTQLDFRQQSIAEAGHIPEPSQHFEHSLILGSLLGTDDLHCFGD